MTLEELTPAVREAFEYAASNFVAANVSKLVAGIPATGLEVGLHFFLAGLSDQEKASGCVSVDQYSDTCNANAELRRHIDGLNSKIRVLEQALDSCKVQKAEAEQSLRVVRKASRMIQEAIDD